MDQSFQGQASNASRIWLPGLIERIASFLPENEVVCTLRLLDKDTLHRFSRCRRVRLSRPSPPAIFKHRWGQPTAFWSYNRKQRMKLLCLTSASGSIENLQVALESAGLLVTQELLEAAGAAGQLGVCQLLRSRGCPWGSALAATARCGHWAVCDWMLASSCPCTWAAVYDAARGGHDALALSLLHYIPFHSGTGTAILQPPPCDAPAGGLSVFSSATLALLHQPLEGDEASTGIRPLANLLAVAAEGSLSLAALQQLHLQLLSGPDGQQVALTRAEQARVLAAAAGSPTLDWQAKVQWLEGLHYPPTVDACTEAAGSAHDPVGRLQWLSSRGYQLSCEAATAALISGNLQALRHILEQWGLRPDEESELVSAHQGHLHVLRYLHDSGVVAMHAIAVAHVAALEGHMQVVAWAVEELGGVTPVSTPVLLNSAAMSGSTALLAWLRGQGWPFRRFIMSCATESGCEEAVEWLAARGCPFPDDGKPYKSAICQGELAMIRCLHRLGCPWGPTAPLASCLSRAAQRVPLTPLLQCLRELNCPLDWEELQGMTGELPADPWDEAPRRIVLAWLTEEQPWLPEAGTSGQ